MTSEQYRQGRKLTLKNNEMETYNFEAMMKKQKEYEAKAERRKIDFFMQELSQEGKKYLREKIMRSEPNHHYLGMCEAYTNLGLGYEEVRKMKTGKYKLELKKK